MATTTDAAAVPPVEEESPAPAAEAAAAAEGEPTKKVEAAAAAEEEKSEGKGEGFGGPEAENGEGKCAGGGEVEEAEEDGKGGSSGAAEADKDDFGGGAVAAPAPAVGSKSDTGESVEVASPDASEGDEKDGLREQQEEGDAAVEAKAVDKVADSAESAVAEEKLESEEDKAEEVGSGTGDGGELGDEEVDFSVESMEMTKQEDKVAPVAEANGELDDKKVASDDVVSGEEAPEESTNKGADVEEEAAKPEPASEASPVVSERHESDFAAYIVDATMLVVM